MSDVIRDAEVSTIVHRCPPDGTGTTPCCGRPPNELPRCDQMTTIRALVTCSTERDTRGWNKRGWSSDEIVARVLWREPEAAIMYVGNYLNGYKDPDYDVLMIAYLTLAHELYERKGER